MNQHCTSTYKWQLPHSLRLRFCRQCVPGDSFANSDWGYVSPGFRRKGRQVATLVERVPPSSKRYEISIEHFWDPASILRRPISGLMHASPYGLLGRLHLGRLFHFHLLPTNLFSRQTAHADALSDTPAHFLILTTRFWQLLQYFHTVFACFTFATILLKKL